MAYLFIYIFTGLLPKSGRFATISMTGFKLLAVMIVLVLSAGVSRAEEGKSLKIRPGNYEITTMSSSTMMPNPRIDTRQTCMKEEKFDPVGDLLKNPGCEISNFKKKDNKISFDFLCAKKDGTRDIGGTGEFSSSGDKFTWKRTIETEFKGDADFAQESEGEAVRKGDCS